jgi:hypothetical protein
VENFRRDVRLILLAQVPLFEPLKLLIADEQFESNKKGSLNQQGASEEAQRYFTS